MQLYLDAIKQIKKLQGCKVLILGDVILDEYIFGHKERISPEAPIPVVNVQRKEWKLGGAANVAANIKSLCGEPILVSVVGNDQPKEKLIELLKEQKIENILMVDTKRPTTVKTRILAHDQQIVRIDNESTLNINASLEKSILNVLNTKMKDCDIIIISDYSKGVITSNMIRVAAKIAKNCRKKIIVDPKKPLIFYSGVYAITPNETELKKFSDYDINSDFSKLICNLKIEVLLVTRGEKGMMILNKNKKTQLPALSSDKEIADVTGAGDTSIAAFAMGIGSGLTPEISAAFANCAAGISVKKIGTAAVTFDDLKNELVKLVDK